MPKQWPRHVSEPLLEQEFDELWRRVDGIEVRENRLRNVTAGVPGPQSATLGTGLHYYSLLGGGPFVVV